MYSREEKGIIIKFLKAGANIYSINNAYGIPIDVLERWKKEIEIRKNINFYLRQRKFEEAKRETDKLEGEENEGIRRHMLVKIASIQGDNQEKLRLLKEMLELKQVSHKDLKDLLRLAVSDGDIETEQKALYRLLELRPTDMYIIRRLISIAREQGNQDERKRLLYLKIERIGADEITLLNLMRIVEKEKDLAELRRLGEMVLGINPRNQEAHEILDRNNIIDVKQTSGMSTLEQEMLRAEETSDAELTPIIKARKIIYESEDVAKGAEEIKELLEGQSPTDVALTLAEFYVHVGMPQRAEKSLKSYKKTLDRASEAGDIRLVNQAIELSKNTRTTQFSWKEFWNAKESQEIPIAPDSPKTKKAPTAPGDDGER